MSTASLISESVYQTVPAAMKDARPRTIVFSSQKGGSGKTTLCGQLAVQAELSGRGPVALIDTDPQGSLSDWWNARDDETPMFVKTSVENLYDTIDEVQKLGIKLVFVDTQPTVTDTIREIIRYGDLVVIPTRPSPHDLRAIGPTVDLVEQCNKPMVFAINCATRKARITGDVAVALSQHGMVAPVTVHNRIDFATSMINGQSVMETNPDGKSAEEIKLLWDYIDNRLSRLEQDEGYQTFDAFFQRPEAPQEAPVSPISNDEASAEIRSVSDEAPPSATPVREVEPLNPHKPQVFGRRKGKGFSFALTNAEAALWE